MKLKSPKLLGIKKA